MQDQQDHRHYQAPIQERGSSESTGDREIFHSGTVALGGTNKQLDFILLLLLLLLRLLFSVSLNQTV